MSLPVLLYLQFCLGFLSGLLVALGIVWSRARWRWPNWRYGVRRRR